MRTFWLLSPEEIAKNLKRYKWRKKFFYANSLEISIKKRIFASEKRIMYNTNLIVMKQNFLLLGLIVLLFTACGKTKTESCTNYSPSIDSIVNQYIQETCASYKCSDSTYYVSVCFWRTKDSLRIHVTGCPFTLVPPPILPRTYASLEEQLEAYRKGDDFDFWCPVYGYYNNGKNQWVIVSYSDSIDVPLLQDIFRNKPWQHDMKYQEWYEEESYIETDMWFYKIEGSRLVLRRKDVW